MIIMRFLPLAATGLLTLSLAACENTSKTADKPARKVYYAHDVQTGSHMQRAYVDPSQATAADGSSVQTGSPGSGATAVRQQHGGAVDRCGGALSIPAARDSG